MDSIHEIIEYSKDLPLKLFCQRIGSVQRHWHRSIELLLVLSGDLDIWLENEHFKLKENDLILINSNQVHETYSEDCVLLALQIRLSMFPMEWLNPETAFFSCNSSIQGDNKHFDDIRSLMAQLIQQYSSTSEYAQLISYSHACKLMHELLLYFKTEQPAVVRSKKQLEHLYNIIDYIDKNYTRQISLNDIAAQEYLSASYLSHFFEKHMKISISNYLTQIRIKHSIRYLLYTDHSIEMIAENCGFSSPRAFATLFKKQYHMLPSQYRKEKKSGNIPDVIEKNQSSNYLNIEKYNIFGKLATYLNTTETTDTMITKNIRQEIGSVSVKSTKPFTNNSLNFCSVGRAKEILYRNIQEMLTTQQEEIGFRYIKFHGIFDDALMVYRENSVGEPILNFNILDEILDFLLSIELRPLVQFSFMPKALAKTPENDFYANPFIMSEPKEDTKWEFLVTEFTRHVINRYGLTEVSRWIFTFWNETLSHLPFDFKSPETSLKLYAITRNAVKSVHPNLSFANTAYINYTVTNDNIKFIFDYFNRNDCMPDVYLFHYYPTSDSTSVDFTNQKMNFMEHLADDHKKLFRDADSFGVYLDKLNQLLPERSAKPLYITEWNLSSSHREWLNDTCFAGTYFIRNILNNYDKADSFCHWSLSDWIEELPFPTELFHGGVGHFTKNGIKKPSYYSYLFLSKLKQELVQCGEGYFITKETGNDNYSIILYNYFHFSELYSKSINFNISFTDRYHVFSNTTAKDFSFSLVDLTNGEYRMTEEIVNRSYGSCFDKWVEMGAIALDNPHEVNVLKNLSNPLLKKTYYQVTDQTLDYNATLEPHEFRLIRIDRKDGIN